MSPGIFRCAWLSASDSSWSTANNNRLDEFQARAEEAMLDFFRLKPKRPRPRSSERSRTWATSTWNNPPITLRTVTRQRSMFTARLRSPWSNININSSSQQWRIKTSPSPCTLLPSCYWGCALLTGFKDVCCCFVGALAFGGTYLCICYCLI